MSYTGNDHLYASLHETGGNEFMKAIYKQRPRYFSQGSLANPLTGTLQPKLGGLFDWLAQFSLPRLDFFGFASLQPPYPQAAPDQFLLTTQAVFNVPGLGILNQQLNIRAVLGAVVNSPVPGKMGFKVLTAAVTPNFVVLTVNVDDLMKAVLNFALAGFSIPYPAFPAGAFTPVLSGPPNIDKNLFILKGNL